MVRHCFICNELIGSRWDLHRASEDPNKKCATPRSMRRKGMWQGAKDVWWGVEPDEDIGFYEGEPGHDERDLLDTEHRHFKARLMV